MSTPYANSGVATAQITLSQTPQKVGTGASGVPLANRLMWRGLCGDTANAVYIGGAGVNSSNGYPLSAGIAEPRPYGPSIDIYAVAASGSPVLFVEEVA